jgi:hypothetical protein
MHFIFFGDVTLNILTALIKIVFEVLGQFLFLLFGEKGFLTGVVTLKECFFAVFLKIFEIGSNASFGDEQDFSDLSGSPPAADEE